MTPNNGLYSLRKLHQLETARIGGWIGTYTGKKYWPLDPRAEDVDIQDISQALSKQCRYGGHCRGFYSVAEHSVYVSQVVERDPQIVQQANQALYGATRQAYIRTYALQALLHDGTEAYVVDVPRPLKVELTNYADIEERNWVVIAEKFNLPYTMHPAVKRADNSVLMAERAVLMPNSPDWAPELMAIEPADVHIEKMDPLTAWSAFMYRYWELTK